MFTTNYLSDPKRIHENRESSRSYYLPYAPTGSVAKFSDDAVLV